MSILGDAIRSNADLHRALYRIVADLAAMHASGSSVGVNLVYLGQLAHVALPHLPAPPREPA